MLDLELHCCIYIYIQGVSQILFLPMCNVHEHIIVRKDDFEKFIESVIIIYSPQVCVLAMSESR